MIGVSFQPGSQDFGSDPRNGSQPSGGSGIQEAIKILSLRLPRVLGAQPAAAMPLLTSQGSGGNPRIDSIVNQVMQRVMPNMGQRPQGAPNFSGATPTSFPKQDTPWSSPFLGPTPRVIVGGGDAVPHPVTGLPVHPRTGQPMPVQDDWMSGGPRGIVEPLPPGFQLPTTPPLPNFDQPIFNPTTPNTGGGGSDPHDFGLPMF